MFALAGADLGATLDGAPLDLGAPHQAPAGAIPPSGVACVARAGGAGRGGRPRRSTPAGERRHRSRRRSLGLVRGQRLATLPAQGRPRPLPALGFDFAYADPGAALCPGGRRRFDRALRGRGVSGQQPSNRTGYRLDGPTLPVPGGRLPLPPGRSRHHPASARRAADPPMADRQTVGGYLCLGHLIAADRPKAAQLWPGDPVRFVAISLVKAHAAARQLAAALA